MNNGDEQDLLHYEYSADEFGEYFYLFALNFYLFCLYFLFLLKSLAVTKERIKYTASV